MTTHDVRYGSSLRAVPIAVTLGHARELGRRLGVVRVTDTTRLDRLGIPVFASIRPGAMPGSLCVSAGKGLTPPEAEIGAWMEAIELSFAEFNRAGLAVVPARIGDLLGGTRPDAIVDLAPRLGAPIAPDDRIPCVTATDIVTGQEVLVPAECVFHPLPPGFAPTIFGTDGNGLSSGNTVDEAVLHGVAELIERDACSFYAVEARANFPIERRSRLVRTDTLPQPVRGHVDRLHEVGVEVYARVIPSEFGIPCFGVVVEESGIAEFHSGFAAHPVRDIAVTRAFTEALQSRLTVIHGGRDDLTRHQELALAPQARRARFQKGLAEFLAGPEPIAYDEIPDCASNATDIAPALQFLVDRLARGGVDRVLRVGLTPAEAPLQVVRVLAPGLEFLHPGTKMRVGRRLRGLGD